MPNQLSPDDIQRMSVDQLSRRLFQVAQHLRHFNYIDLWARLVAGRVPNGPLETKVDDAFFRLVERHLVRWSEGPQATAAHYVLTERGRTSRFGDGAIDDPEPFIAEIQTRIGSPLDPVLRQYLEESVACFHYDRLLSSQFSLGAVAERVAFMVRDWAVELVQDGDKLNRLELVGHVVTALPKALEQIKKGRPDWSPQVEAFSDCLESCAGVYRRTRNEVGHPTVVREIDEEELTVMLKAMRSRYLPAAYDLLKLRPS